MMPPFRAPCLAATLMPSDVEHTDENIFKAMQQLRYPVAATRKVDGIRGLRFNNSLLSRVLKPLPNLTIRKMAMAMWSGSDCETCNEDWPYNINESVIMSEEHPDAENMHFHLLDFYMLGGYLQRCEYIADKMMPEMPPYVKFQYPHVVYSAGGLFDYFIAEEQNDGEGICFRTPGSPYFQKNTLDNRSTLIEQMLVKLARYIREEGVVIGFEEQTVNLNPVKRNALGRMNRSSAIGNKQGKNILGALIVRTTDDKIVRVANGFTDKLRREIWFNKAKWLNRVVVYKHKPYGRKNKPRSPIYVGERKVGT